MKTFKCLNTYGIFNVQWIPEVGKKGKKMLEKSVLVLDFISAQLGQFTTSNCTH